MGGYVIRYPLASNQGGFLINKAAFDGHGKNS